MRRGALLRLGSGMLLAIGVVLHLWLGSMVGLWVAATGLVAHGAAAILGRRWLRRRDRPAPLEAPPG